MIACALYCCIILAPCALAAACGRRFERALAPSLFLFWILLYFAGLLGALPSGVTAALLLAIGCAAIAVIRIVLKRIPLATFFGNLLTPAFAVFLLLFALAVFCNVGRAPYHGDEFSHWAYTVKAMSYCNDFSTVPAANALYASYPPGMSLLQYAMQRLVFLTGGRVYTEWLLFTPYQTTAFILLLSVSADGLSWRKAPSLLPLIAAILTLPAILYPLFYESLFADPLIGILSGYLLALVWRTERYDALDCATLCMGLFVLTLLKDAGLFFATVCALVILLDLGRAGKPLSGWTRAGVVAAVAAAKFSWANHLSVRNVPLRFSETAPLSTLVAIVNGSETGFRRTAFHNFLRAPFEGRVQLGADTFTMFGKPVPGWMFHVSFLLLALVLALLLYSMANRHSGKLRTVTNVRRNRIVNIALLSLFVYWIGLLGLYTLKFVEFEAVCLYCYERYFSIPFLMLATLLFSTLSNANAGKRTFLRNAVIAVLLLAIAPLHSIYPYLTRRATRGSAEAMAPQREIAALVERTVPPEKTLYLLSQESDGEGLAQKYLLYPRIITGGAIGTPMYDGDPWTKDLTCTQWQTILKSGYDYVLLAKADTLFSARCAEAFYEPSTMEDGALYMVDRDTGMLTFIAAP